MLRKILATVYLTYLLTQASVFNRPREVVLAYTIARELLNCPRCTGFWAAILVYLLPSWAVTILAMAGGNLLVALYTEREDSDNLYQQ